MQHELQPSELKQNIHSYICIASYWIYGKLFTSDSIHLLLQFGTVNSVDISSKLHLISQFQSITKTYDYNLLHYYYICM